jgi:hypothetical protein
MDDTWLTPEDDSNLRPQARALPKLSYSEFVDGEADLRKETDLVTALAASAHSAWVQVLLETERYKHATKLLRRRECNSEPASEVLFDLCEKDCVTLRQLAELVAYGADVNYRRPAAARTPIHFLAENLASTKVQYLCAHGADCNVLDQSSTTPLIAACRVYPHANKTSIQNQIRTVKVLLAQKLNTIDHADCEGNTALDFGVAANAVWVVKALVSAGASVIHSKVHALLQKERRERTLLSQYFIDYEASDLWVGTQVLRYGAMKVCRGLIQFKLRMELRTSVSSRAVLTAVEDRIDIANRDMSAVVIEQAPTVDAIELTPEQKAKQLEQVYQRRKQHKEAKRQARQAKEQTTLETERETKKLEYLKRVEDQYKVSLQGLFPR